MTVVDTQHAQVHNLEQKKTKLERMPSVSIEEEVSVEDEEPGASRAGHWSQADTKSLYQLGDTGLWWDSFEEEPDFELVEEFDSQLTLTEGQGVAGCVSPEYQ